MDKSEQTAQEYLKSIGLSDIVYEPDGNVPPDFAARSAIGDYIAIEVRRLNQTYDNGDGTGPRGLEETAIPLWNHVKKYLTSLRPASPGSHSWYVFFRFSRPTPAWKDLKQELDRVLRPFMDGKNPEQLDCTLRVGRDFSVKVFPAGSLKPTYFRLAGCSDQQSGGFLIAEIEEGLKYCVAEKTAKIEPYRAKYNEWWLILADHIGYGLDEFERELFADQIEVQAGIFSRIILLDPRDPTRSFVVHPKV